MNIFFACLSGASELKSIFCCTDSNGLSASICWKAEDTIKVKIFSSEYNIA
jgi:hypothetical protein